VQTQKLISTVRNALDAIQNFQEETMKLAINSLYRQPRMFEYFDAHHGAHKRRNDRDP